MKRMGLFVLMVLVTGLSFGCGKLTQDPASGVPPIQKKPGKVPVEKPGDPNAIRPGTLDGYNFVLEREQSIPLEATILVDNYEIEAHVENLAAFPGATFDPATSAFIWKPTREFFSDELKKEVILNVTFIGLSTGNEKTVFRRDWPVKLTVTRSPEQPAIVAMSQFPNYIDEGSIQDLWFEVSDEDAGKSIDLFPELIMNHQTKSNELAPFVTISPAEVIRSGNFRYAVRLDLRNVELTTTSKTFSLSFSPRSRYGVMGGSKVWEITVVTTLSRPVISWNEKVFFKEGVETKHSFYILDPKGEGSLKLVEEKAKLPQQSKLECDSSQNPNILLCTFTWLPKIDISNNESFSILVDSIVTYGNKSKFRSEVYPLEMEVVPSEVSKGIKL